VTGGQLGDVLRRAASKLRLLGVKMSISREVKILGEVLLQRH